MNSPQNSAQQALSRRQAKCLERVSINRPAQLMACAEKEANITAAAEATTAVEERLKLVDLSNCGVGLLASKPYPVNQNITLKFSLPTYAQTQQLTLNGLVKHATAVHNHYLIGCQLFNLSVHDQLVIKEFFAFHRRLQS